RRRLVQCPPHSPPHASYPHRAPQRSVCFQDPADASAYSAVCHCLSDGVRYSVHREYKPLRPDRNQSVSQGGYAAPLRRREFLSPWKGSDSPVLHPSGSPRGRGSPSEPVCRSASAGLSVSVPPENG